MQERPVILRVLSHPLGLIGTVFVGVFVICALLGNLITTDKTENANLIHLPSALLKPGTKRTFFTAHGTPRSAFAQWLKGASDPLLNIDILKYQILSDSIELRLRVPDGNHVTEKYALKDFPNGYSIRKVNFLLGTDGFGRDVLSRILTGSRVSLSVGFVAVFLSLLIGSVLGLMAGFFRGWTDVVISWFINVVWSLPTMLLVVAVSFAIGKGFWQIFIAIGLSSWVEVARVVRGQVFGIREKEYIQAAKILGFRSARIMFRHILPNLKSSLIVLAVSVFGSAILLESGLSFLGLGLAPPAPSWGMMIRENYPYIMFDSAYLAIVPGAAIMLLVTGFNFIGVALRDALDVNLR